MEYLIKRTDGEWFELPYSRFPEVLRPRSLPAEPITGWGDHRIRVLGGEIAFSDEDPGIQVIFVGDTLNREQARQIVQEIAQNVMRATGQGAHAIEID